MDQIVEPRLAPQTTTILATVQVERRPDMTRLDDHCRAGLEQAHERSLFRSLRTVTSEQGVEVRRQGRPLIAFASNDYLGLAHHPKLKTAAKEAVHTFGVGAGASRLITGTQRPHDGLESQLAQFKNAEAALSFATGYQTALGTLATIVNPEDTVFSDQLNHACLIDAMRLSRAAVHVFQHNDMDHLETLLRKAADQRSEKHPGHRGNLLIVTESVFSMDGDQAPLREITTLKQQFETWLMVDEAHATGLYGTNRSGLAEATETADQIDIQMGTLGKALGCAGGFVCGSQLLRDFLINRSRSFIFSTAPSPPIVAAAQTAIELIQGQEGADRSQTLWQRVHRLSEILQLPTPPQSPILPVIIGEEETCLNIAKGLEEAGFLVPAIRYPSVARGQARLRITLSADHTEAHIEALGEALLNLLPDRRI